MESRWFVLELVELETGSGRHDSWRQQCHVKIQPPQKSPSPDLALPICYVGLSDLMTYLSSEK